MKSCLIFSIFFLLFSNCFADTKYKNCKIGEFNPSQISDCKLWLDSSDLETITFRVGTDYVAEWDDKSGNGNNVVQASESLQPIYQSDVINKLGMIDFDGSNDNIGGNITSEFATVFLVVKPNVVISTNSATQPLLRIGYYQGLFLGSGTGTLDNELITVMLEGGDNPRSAWGATNDTINTNGHILVTSWNSEDVQYDIYYDGVLKTNLSNGTPYLKSMTALFLGFSDSGANFNGKFGEVIIYDRVLKEVERLQVQKNLSKKWEINLN